MDNKKAQQANQIDCVDHTMHWMSTEQWTEREIVWNRVGDVRRGGGVGEGMCVCVCGGGGEGCGEAQLPLQWTTDDGRCLDTGQCRGQCPGLTPRDHCTDRPSLLPLG